MLSEHISHGFRYLQAKTRIVAWNGPDFFLPKPFKFTLTIYHPFISSGPR